MVYQFLLLGVFLLSYRISLQIVQGSSPFIAGIAMLPGAAVGALLSPFSGKLLDQYGPKKPIFAGLLLALIGWSSIILLIGHASLRFLIACHVFLYGRYRLILQ